MQNINLDETDDEAPMSDRDIFADPMHPQLVLDNTFYSLSDSDIDSDGYPKLPDRIPILEKQKKTGNKKPSSSSGSSSSSTSSDSSSSSEDETKDRRSPSPPSDQDNRSNSPSQERGANGAEDKSNAEAIQLISDSDTSPRRQLTEEAVKNAIANASILDLSVDSSNFILLSQ